MIVVPLRRCGPALVALLLCVLLAAILPAQAADATEVSTRNTRRLLDDLSHHQLVVRYDDGKVARGDVLRFREHGSTVQLRPRSARETVAGLETMSSMSATELSRGAVAGTNGGYWLGRPTGAPNGLHIEDARVLAGDSTNRSGTQSVGRGTAGIHVDGSVVMDRLQVVLRLDVAGEPDREPVDIDELNRQVRTSTDGTRTVGDEGELLLFDGNYGTSFDVPGGSTLLVVDELALGSSGRVTGTVREAGSFTGDTSFRVPDGSSAVLAYGERAKDLEGIGIGSEIGVTTLVTPFATAIGDWENLRGAIAGGPLLIRDGERRSVIEWRTEAFSDSHLTGRQPRTAIARTSQGRILMVTIDGRQNGWSVGATLRELSEILLQLGAVDAVNLDGGGSSTMTVNAHIRNRPSEANRSVANGLFLYASPPPEARGLALACPDSTPRAGFDDTVGTIHESSIDCLAWWGVTTGVTPSTYAPNRSVTREQMASFLARWVDDVAARGDGQALPASAELEFDDVSESSAHAQAIARLSAAGVITGRTATTYEPQASVSRAQTASLLLASIEYVTGSTLPGGRDTFVDDSDIVHEASIDTLADSGVITGTGGFAYEPQAAVTRGSMAALVMRASDLLVEQEHVAPPS